MKKIVLALLVAAVFATATPASAEANGPQVGDEKFGFTVKSLIPMEVLGAEGVLYEHKKSGAELLYLASDDTNRSFDISFKTPALDATGKPHVFEHITISGSSKYPEANLFFPFINQTYSTFVNAYTYSGMTSFPLASLSEKQLMSMMDYYLSAVFTPLLYSEPRLAKREAWRYELTDAEAPLNIAGTVYSEMQGAMDMAEQATEYNLETLYAGSPVAHNSGGEPEWIKTLTSDDLIEFHDAYYHPSNALIILYGDLDIDGFLEYIDSEYLSKYDKKDVYVERGAVEPYKETLYKTYDMPVERGAATEKASFIFYSFAADGADMDDTLNLAILTNYLNSEASPVMKGVREKLPGASVAIYTSMDMPTPAVMFKATGVDETDRDTLVDAVDSAIEEIVENGINADDFESIIALQKLSLLLAQENSSLGVNASMNIALAWSRFGTVDYYNVYESAVNTITAETAAKIAEKYLKNNTHRAVSVTRPAPGLAEENAAKLQAELAQTKAAMSADEIDEIVKQTKEFMDWSSAAPDAEIIKSLANMTVGDLPEEIKHYDVSDETKNGVRYVTAAANIAGIAQAEIALDGSVIPENSLRDCQVYLSLLGKIDTAKHTKEELATLAARYLSGFSAGLSATSSYGGGEGLYAAALGWTGLKQDVKNSVELVKELLLETKLDEVDDIVNLLTRNNNDTRDSFDAAALNIQLSRLAAAVNDANAYNCYVSGIDMYAHINEMLDNPETITSRLEAARDILVNKRGAIVKLAGDAETISAYENELSAFVDGLPDVQREKTDKSALRLPITSEAVINNSSVHMNVITEVETDFSGKYVPLAKLINDVYLLPNLRNALGAYGAYCSFGTNSSALYTYRDPNVGGTFEAYAKIGEYLRNCDITQDDVDRYIIGSYSGLSAPKGELSGALSAVNNYLIGVGEETRLNWLREAKSLTVGDVRAIADRVDALVENGVRSTSGTVTSIGEDIKLFDSVVRLEEAPTSDAAA